VHDVAVFCIGKSNNATDIATQRSKRWFLHRCLDTVLDLIGKLGAPQGKELDAVIGRWVM